MNLKNETMSADKMRAAFLAWTLTSPLADMPEDGHPLPVAFYAGYQVASAAQAERVTQLQCNLSDMATKYSEQAGEIARLTGRVNMYGLCLNTGGIDQLCAAHVAQVARLTQELTERDELLALIPRTPEQMISFIGPHYESMTFLDDSDTRYRLSVHDLLSAFEWAGFHDVDPIEPTGTNDDLLFPSGRELAPELAPVPPAPQFICDEDECSNVGKVITPLVCDCHGNARCHPAPQAAVDERAAFISWATTTQSKNAFFEIRWDAWSARASIAAPVQAQVGAQVEQNGPQTRMDTHSTVVVQSELTSDQILGYANKHLSIVFEEAEILQFASDIISHSPDAPVVMLTDAPAYVNTHKSLEAAQGTMEDLGDAADLVDAMASASTKGDALAAVFAYRHKIRVGLANGSQGVSTVGSTVQAQGDMGNPMSELLAALQRLENANDTICQLRTSEQYLSMVDGGQQDALIELDNARFAARDAITIATTSRPPVAPVQTQGVLTNAQRNLIQQAANAAYSYGMKEMADELRALLAASGQPVAPVQAHCALTVAQILEIAQRDEFESAQGTPYCYSADAVIALARTLLAASCQPVDEALRLAVERTRNDLGPTGDNYPAIRKLLSFAESAIAALTESTK